MHIWYVRKVIIKGPKSPVPMEAFKAHISDVDNNAGPMLWHGIVSFHQVTTMVL